MCASCESVCCKTSSGTTVLLHAAQRNGCEKITGQNLGGFSTVLILRLALQITQLSTSKIPMSSKALLLAWLWQRRATELTFAGARTLDCSLWWFVCGVSRFVVANLVGVRSSFTLKYSSDVQIPTSAPLQRSLLATT